MKIIVPMAGQGARFQQAGYADPKPLIRIRDVGGHTRRILAHVVGMFRKTDDFVFVCNDEHLDTTEMHGVIQSLCPRATIVAMPAHKLGPVHTVNAAMHHVADDEQVIVSYCDGAVRWNRDDFERYVFDRNLDGCLFTHTGFHPHTLNTTKMAFCRLSNDLVAEVREKASFTDEPMTEHASSGVYWFKRGSDVKRYFARAEAEGIQHNGEFYVTLVYNLLIRDKLRVGYFDTPGVAILGTPAEVQNFEAWSVILRGEQAKNEDDVVRLYHYWATYHGISVK